MFTTVASSEAMPEPSTAAVTTHLPAAEFSVSWPPAVLEAIAQLYRQCHRGPRNSHKRGVRCAPKGGILGPMHRLLKLLAPVLLAALAVASVPSIGTAQQASYRFVVVSHGQASDPFWSVVKNGVDQ